MLSGWVKFDLLQRLVDAIWWYVREKRGTKKRKKQYRDEKKRNLTLTEKRNEEEKKTTQKWGKKFHPGSPDKSSSVSTLLLYHLRCHSDWLLHSGFEGLWRHRLRFCLRIRRNVSALLLFPLLLIHSTALYITGAASVRWSTFLSKLLEAGFPRGRGRSANWRTLYGVFPRTLPAPILRWLRRGSRP